MGRAARELEFSGVFAAGVTSPRKGTLEVDFCAAMDLGDFLAEEGVKGVTLLSAAGEFLHYSVGDRERLVYLASKRTRIPLLAGVTHSTFAGSVELGEAAISAGADGLVVMPPFFYSYRQEDIETFLVEFAREVGSAVPIFIDHTPRFASTLDLSTLEKLLVTGIFAGIIDSSGDWATFQSLLQLRESRRFTLVCGDDSCALPAIAAGADAVLLPSACAVPELMVTMDKAARRGDLEKADRLNGYLQVFLKRLDPFSYPLGLKRAVELRGQSAAVPAVPLSSSSRAALDEFSTWFKGWLPEMKAAARA